MSWVDEFVAWYNDEQRHSGIRYVTPNERHEGLYVEILEQKKLVYLKSKKYKSSPLFEGYSKLRLYR
jgi:putative transposase